MSLLYGLSSRTSADICSIFARFGPFVASAFASASALPTAATTPSSLAITFSSIAASLASRPSMRASIAAASPPSSLPGPACPPNARARREPTPLSDGGMAAGAGAEGGGRAGRKQEGR